MYRGILVSSIGNEQKLLGKEHNSSFFPSKQIKGDIMSWKKTVTQFWMRFLVH